MRARTWLADVVTTKTKVLTVYGVTEEEARSFAGATGGGEVVHIVEIAECSTCGGRASVDAPRKFHRRPGCRGKWSA